LAVKKGFEGLTWLLNWVSGSCSYCFSGASSLSSQLSIGYSSLSPDIVYCLDRVGFVQSMQILTCGVVIWSALKVLKLVGSIL